VLGRILLSSVAAALVALSGSAMPGAAQPADRLHVSISVSLPDGSAAAGATIFLNDQRLEAGPDGRWQGLLPGGGRIYEAAALPGYVSRGEQWFDPPRLPAGVSVTVPISDQLVSVFDADGSYPANTTPPTIETFVTDGGLDHQQVLPGEPGSVTVTGGAGDAGGQPYVRGDGWLALPDGSVSFVPVSIKGQTFSATFRLDHGPGSYRVEINSASGRAIINVPLFVGVPYAPEPPIWPRDQDLAPEVSVARAFEALNHLRQARGLPTVSLDPRLVGIAEDHVADQVAHDWYCHCWADGTTLDEHARAAGIDVRLRPAPGGEPGALAYGLGEGFATLQGSTAIDQLFSSPGHRHDLLGEWTHVGIAAATGALPIVVIEYADER
jgi:uncharacterized protein YkwD